MLHHAGGLVTAVAALTLWSAPMAGQSRLHVASPDRRNQVTVELLDGRLTYRLDRDGRALLLPSQLGFEFRGAAPLREGLRLTDSTRRSYDQWWTQPWGEVARVRDHHNELAVTVEESAPPSRRFILRIRAFDDGIGFRYELPEQPNLGSFEMTEELTEFALVDNARAWWIPSDRPRMDRSEMLYSSGPVSVVDSVQTPLTLEITDRRSFLVIHEANLVDYARMNLGKGPLESRTLRDPHSRLTRMGSRCEAGPRSSRRGEPSRWPIAPNSWRRRCWVSTSILPPRSPAPTGSSR